MKDLDRAWLDLSGALDDAVTRIAEMIADDDVSEAEVPVAVLGAMMASFLERVCADTDHPAFVPGSGYHQHVGTPNPDTVYLTAAIDGTGTYRITGSRGSVPEATVMAMGSPGRSGMITYPPFDLDDLWIGPDGTFDVVLSAERPEGHAGDWWRLPSDARTLMLRSVSDDWGAHQDPVVSITRLDRSPRRLRPNPNLLTSRLATVPKVVERSLGFGIRKVAGLRARGVINVVEVADYSAGGGLPGQSYHEGLYQLAEDEVLLLEADLGDRPRTFSLALTDGMGCTLDWANAQTSLNRTQATIDQDGILRVAVARHDPGIANWLDTMGHSTGIMQLRWTGTAAPPNIGAQRLALAELPAWMPPATRFVDGRERDEALRRRTISAQQRTMW